MIKQTENMHHVIKGLSYATCTHGETCLGDERDGQNRERRGWTGSHPSPLPFPHHLIHLEAFSGVGEEGRAGGMGW